jgi:NhaA family Na+:H+ antiporter
MAKNTRKQPPPGIIGAFQEFVHSEVSASIVLLVCSVIALAWANSPWGDVYDELMHVKIGLSAGSGNFTLSVHDWINDGLMVVFFFVVGLEVKRELVVGHLSSVKKATLPVMAAAGGMLVPALLYLALNYGQKGAAGWGIPTATDIAFALGVLALFSERVPIGLKVYLLALAIADDIGAVLVIAIFYTSQIVWTGLAIAAVFLVLLYLAIAVWHVRTVGVLAVLVIGVWVGVFTSGIHATIAGILMALLVPVRPRIEPGQFLEISQHRLDLLDDKGLTKESVIADPDQLDAIVELHEVAGEMRPPGLALEQYFHPISAFVVLPLFALANAGVHLSGDKMEMVSHPITWGVILGLVLGKQLGVTALSWLVIKSGRADLPEGVNWTHIYGASCLAGIGFTMSLFVSDLAFDDAALIDAAKLGILTASLTAAALGYVVLTKSLPKK